MKKLLFIFTILLTIALSSPLPDESNVTSTEQTYAVAQATNTSFV